MDASKGVHDPSPNRRHTGGSCTGLVIYPQIEGVSLGKGLPFLHVARARRIARARGVADTVRG